MSFLAWWGGSKSLIHFSWPWSLRLLNKKWKSFFFLSQSKIKTFAKPLYIIYYSDHSWKVLRRMPKAGTYHRPPWWQKLDWSSKGNLPYELWWEHHKCPSLKEQQKYMRICIVGQKQVVLRNKFLLQLGSLVAKPCKNSFSLYIYDPKGN